MNQIRQEATNHCLKFFQEYTEPPAFGIGTIVTTPNPNKLILLNSRYTTGDVWIFDKFDNEYHHIGHMPSFNGTVFSLADEYDHKIIKLPHITKHPNVIILLMLTSAHCAESPEGFSHHGFTAEININTHTMNWFGIDQTNNPEIDNQWYYDCLHCSVCLLKTDPVKIMLIPNNENKELMDGEDRCIDIIEVDRNFHVITMKDVVPFKPINTYIIPMTKCLKYENCPNDYLLLAKKPNTDKLFAMLLQCAFGYSEKFRDMEDYYGGYWNHIVEIDSLPMGNLANIHDDYDSSWQMTHIVFNDHLLMFDQSVDLKNNSNQCHIFSFARRKWICSIDMPYSYIMCTVNISHGVIYFIIQPVEYGGNYKMTKHLFGMDIGNMFNGRIQIFYAIRRGLERLDGIGLEISKIMFELIDDTFIVSHFEQREPWLMQSGVMFRYAVWYELESIFLYCQYGIIERNERICYDQSMYIMKQIFNFIDDINLEEHHLVKPWVNSFRLLQH